MGERALVLGGGGPVGIAWESGVLAGLKLEGVAPPLDFVLGTSAGSFVGAQICAGRDPVDLAEAQVKLGREERAAGAGAGGPMKFDPSSFVALVQKLPTDAEPTPALMQEFGQLSLSATAVPEEAFLLAFQSFERDWPTGFACTAVDIESGVFRLFTAGDGAPLNRAIAASCSVPGIFAPITIGDRRYMDGGVRASTSADKARGYAKVLTLAVVTPLTGPFVSNGVAREQAALKAAGADALVITPDEEALSVFGTNLMNAKNRAEVAEAGIAQGRREAAKVKAFWG